MAGWWWESRDNERSHKLSMVILNYFFRRRFERVPRRRPLERLRRRLRQKVGLRCRVAKARDQRQDGGLREGPAHQKLSRVELDWTAPICRLHIWVPIAHVEDAHSLCKGKYRCTTDHLFNWFGFNQSNKSVDNLNIALQASKTGQPYSKYFPLQSKWVFSGTCSVVLPRGAS